MFPVDMQKPVKARNGPRKWVLDQIEAFFNPMDPEKVHK